MNGLLRMVCCLAAICVALAVGTSQAGVLLVAGSPGYDPATGTGLRKQTYYFGLSSCDVNNTGTTVGYLDKYASGSDMGYRAVCWNASGTAATELGNLGTDGSGVTYTQAYAINNSGMAVGSASKYVSGSYIGHFAVRWDASGTVATELGILGTDVSGVTYQAIAINDAGTAVGYADQFNIGGNNYGYRAMRWDFSGTAATELGILGTDGSGYTNAYVEAINYAGTAVGSAYKYDAGSYKGSSAVRWEASGTAATELGNLGTSSGGNTEAHAYAINNVGTAVGYARKYDGGINKGCRAVRWDASGSAATELGNLGLDTYSLITPEAKAYAVNSVGTAVGYAFKAVGGNPKGSRAVRWDASGTAATELGNLGTSSNGSTEAEAYAVNDAGTAVGYARKYIGGNNVGYRAAIWLPDASVIDLNDLGIAPVSESGTWTLLNARALSADGYVTGEGTYDPDGAGSLASYTRLWVAQVGLGGNWTNAAGGTWGRGPNWSTGTPAMQVGNATFNSNSAYTVALDRNELTKTIAIDAGTVAIDFNGHTLSTESGLSIANGATLKGAGTILGDIINAGAIAPGTSPGTLNITGNLTNTGTLGFEIAGLSNYDQVNLTGTFTVGGVIAVDLLGGFAPAAGDVFDIMDFGSLTNNGYTFDWTNAALSPGLTWDTTAFATTGTIGVVPEPSTLMLLGIAAVGIISYVRLRRTA
jgi:hypothetical protein